MSANPIVQATFVTGRKSGIDTSVSVLTATSTILRRGVTIKAASGNTTTVYVGLATVTADAADATDGFPLAAGDVVGIEIDDPSKVYVKGSGAGPAKVFWIGD